MNMVGNIIDTCVNANPPGSDGQAVVANSLGSVAPFESAEQLIERMDRTGVARAIVGPPVSTAVLDEDAGYRWTLQAVQRHPERLSLAVRADPHGMMESVRALERMVKSDGAVALRLGPARTGKPLNDKVYFPLYTKCVELNIPIVAPVGLPAPKIPGMMQHPQYLDELCYLWPELTVVTTHGGQPWTPLLVELMAKWPNLYHVISAFAPKYFPRDTVAYLNSSRGRHKVMFGSDHPYLTMDRVISELPAAGIAEASLPAFLSGNAEAVFFQRGGS